MVTKFMRFDDNATINLDAILNLEVSDEGNLCIVTEHRNYEYLFGDHSAAQKVHDNIAKYFDFIETGAEIDG